MGVFVDPILGKARSTVDGAQGATGVAGATGATGAGTTGATGAAGATGATGPAGVGSTGATGTQGIQGATGPTGPQGDIGAQGYTGATGIQGATGATGAGGNTGATGIGTQGFTGAEGATGATGPAGIDGGNVGLYTYDDTSTANSDPGSGKLKLNNATLADVTEIYVDLLDGNGIDLTNWLDSFDDSSSTVKSIIKLGRANSVAHFAFYTLNSTTSETGYRTLNVAFIASGGSLSTTALNTYIGYSRTGDQGMTGATGSPGPEGSTGPVGATGVQGTTGATGTQGVQGATGATGSAGTQGATGAQGVQGSTGATGSQGTQGSTGATGVQGITGSTGVTGATGTQGATGSTGPVRGDYIDVKYDYSAEGDGTTDDSTALQNAINAATTNKKDIVFPSGVYLLDSFIDIKDNTHFIGMGDVSIYLPDTLDLTGAPSYGGKSRAIGNSAASITNIRFENITFYGDTASLTQSVTVAFNNATNISFTNCTFKDFGDATYYSQGLAIFNSDDVMLDRCTFRNNSGDGVAIAESGNRCLVNNCIFDSNDDWGIAISNSNDSVVISNCIAKDNAEVGIGMDECTEVNILGNIITGNTTQGIRIARFGGTTDAQQYCNIIGNTLKSNGVNISVENCTTLAGIIVSNNISHLSTTQNIAVVNTLGVIISNNYLYDSGAEAVRFLSNDSATPCGQGIVIGNFIDDCTYGIRMLATGTGTLSNNITAFNNVTTASVATYNGVIGDFMLNRSTYFDLSKALNFPTALSSTTATAGANTLPSNPVGFITTYVNGTARKVPYYAT